MFSRIEQTMNELDNERPFVNLDKGQVDYQDALNPSRSSGSISTENLFDSSKAVFIEKGNQFAQKMQKPLSMIGKLFQGMTPTEEKNPPLPPRPSSTDLAAAQQDIDLQKLYDMFPNIAPDVCKIVFNASDGVLLDAVDRYIVTFVLFIH